MYTLSDIFEGDYPVSQTFGANPSYYSQFYIYGIKQKSHEGVDFATPIGIKIISPFPGKILRVGQQNDFPLYGNVVVVWDPVQKCAVWFCHLSEIHVTVGQTVNIGQDLGKTGATGNVQGPHLHFGLVETDSNGNRLHQNDGYGGFINSLDSSKVKWVLGPPPIDPYVAKFDQLKIIIDRLQQETDVLNSQVDKKGAYDATITKINKIAATGSL